MGVHQCDSITFENKLIGQLFSSHRISLASSFSLSHFFVLPNLISNSTG